MLSDFFSDLAKEARDCHDGLGDGADNHKHLWPRWPPFNKALSDDVDSRIVPFNKHNRDKVLQYNSVRANESLRGSFEEYVARARAEYPEVAH